MSKSPDEFDEELFAMLRLQQEPALTDALVKQRLYELDIATRHLLVEQRQLAKSMKIEVRCGEAVYRGTVYLVEEQVAG